MNSISHLSPFRHQEGNREEAGEEGNNNGMVHQQNVLQNEPPQHPTILQKFMPYLAVIAIQFIFAAMNLLMKAAIDKGISNYVFVVYRNGFASIPLLLVGYYLERNVRPTMTMKLILKLGVLSLIGNVLDQNFYFAGMKLTTPAFAAALSNMVPTLVFVLACIFRLETINITNRASQKKVIGTIVTLAGALVMTLVKGPILHGVVRANSHSQGSHGPWGAVFILLSCLCTASSAILSIHILDTYPAPLSITALTCLFGSVEGMLVAIFVEDRFQTSIWSYFKWDMLLFTALYAGIFCSGIAFFLRLIVSKVKGPVFASAFTPTCMILVTLIDVIFLHEVLFLGRLIGAIVISLGLFCVLWGNARGDNGQAAEE